MSDGLIEEVTEDEPKCTVDDGVLVVTIRRRRPGAIFSVVVQLLEESLTRLGSPLKAVVDVRDSAFSPTGSEIRAGALRLADLRDRGKVALLVGSDFQFGLGRMAGLLAEGTGFDIRPFRDAPAATRWVRESSHSR